MKRFYNVISIIALIVCIVGALNWLSIGIFDFNIVEWISGNIGWISAAIYILVGISGIYMAVWLFVARFRMANVPTEYVV